MHRVLRREGTDPLLAWIGTLLFYVSSMYFVAPVARPDGLGLLLMMSGVWLLFKDAVPRCDLVWALAAALLASATKPYFAFPAFVYAAYTFLFRSKRDGLIYGGLAAITCAALTWGLTVVFPGYVTVTLMNNYDTPFGLALAAGGISVAAASVVLERLLYARLYTAGELDQVLFSIGLIFMSIAAAKFFWGSLPQRIVVPEALRGPTKAGIWAEDRPD